MKSGKCTNIDCQKFGEMVELQDWEDMICQEEDCGQELMEVAEKPPVNIKNIAMIAAAVLGIGLLGFGGYQWLGTGSTELPPNGGATTTGGGESGRHEAFASIEGLLKMVASPDLTEREIDAYVEDVLSLCDNPNIEVRLVNIEGIVTEKLPIHLFLDRLRVLQEDNFQVKTIYPTKQGDKMATLEIIETNVG